MTLPSAPLTEGNGPAAVLSVTFAPATGAPAASRTHTRTTPLGESTSW